MRPVLIVQNDTGNRHSPTVIAAAITSQTGKARLPTHIELSANTYGLPKESVVLLEQIRTLDKRRLREHMGRLDEAQMQRVDNAIAVSFGLHTDNWFKNGSTDTPAGGPFPNGRTYMKKTHWPARLAAGCLVTLTLVGVAFAAGQQGSQSDPLVTLSYLTQKATPSILSQVDSKLTARETELKKQLSAVVEGYVKEVEDKLASSGGGSSVQPSGGASYQVVNLSAGQTITGGAACEFLLRSGTATCVSDTSPGLVDMTAGTTLAGGGALTANHLYLATIEGRGVKASTAGPPGPGDLSSIQ